MTPTLVNAIADVRRALIEFWLDAQRAASVDDALRVRRIAGDLAVEFGAVEDLALDRADELLQQREVV